MSALSFLSLDTNQVYYTRAFRDVLESYLPTLRISRNTTSRVVTKHDANRFTTDLDGYLYAISIPAYMHWIIMRVNGMRSPQDFTTETEYLYIPSMEELEQIRQVYMTSR